MKNVLSALLLTVLLAGCASVNVKGLYHSDDCADDSENCFQYNFHNDGSFTYWYTNSVFGDFFVSGNYYVIGKQLKLTPSKYIYHDSTNIQYSPRPNADSIHIRISMLPGHFKNKPDTMHVPWLIKVNDAPFFDETDEYGLYSLCAESVSKIEIKEYSAKFYMDSEIPEADTTIFPSKTNCNIDVYLASSVLEPIVIPPVSIFRIHKKGAFLESLDTMDIGYWKHTTRGYVR
ncbi:MAG: hypothetical protein MJZ61_06650 [Bacteroidales bacterium]|nr:hypothetical protein [Bacteroidales bacterium]